MQRITVERLTSPEATRLLLTACDTTDQATEYRTEYALEACSSVTCHCRDWTMVETAGTATDPARPAEFLLDPFERSLVPSDTTRSLPGQPSATAIAAAISAEDWSALAHEFFAAKARAFAAIDFSTESAEFPFEEVERHGQLVPIRDVIPFAPSFTAPHHDGREFLVDEHYCVRPGCDCTMSIVGLHLYSRPDPNSTRMRAEPLLDFQVDWQRNTWQIAGQTRQLTDAQADLRDLLVANNPDLLDELRHRHYIMRKLYEVSAAGRRQTSLVPHRAGPRVGRNEPCPCGSGKKYKRCCLPG